MNAKRCNTGAASVMLTAMLAACGGGASGASGVVPTSPTTATPPSSGGSGSSSAQTCPNGSPTSSGTLDCTALPLGDRKYTTTVPTTTGYIYDCNTPSGNPVVGSAPWLNASNGTWDGSTDANGKISVQGSNAWNGSFSEGSDGTNRTIAGNGEPLSPVTTGTFPIQSSDPAWQYDRNPNTIDVHSYRFVVPSNPSAASQPHCVAGGAIGVAVDGVAIYDGFDGAGYDAIAHEVQDTCHGHPDQSGTYHYHGWLQACVTDTGSATQDSSLLGYAADGYGIYGAWYNGKILTSKDLDVCHGTTSAVTWDGKLTTIYHYVSTYDFPYTIGCFHGTPASMGL